MKPDGTYSVQELLDICFSQLQSWEREDLADKLIPCSVAYQKIKTMDPDEIADVTGYYCAYDEPDADEFELDDYRTESLVAELVERGDTDDLLQAIDEADHKHFVAYVKEEFIV